MPEVPDTVDDAIEPLSSPSTDEVFEATRPFSAREIASAAASEALSGGGGSPVLTASVTLNHAQILTLVSTRVELLAPTQTPNYSALSDPLPIPIAGTVSLARPNGSGGNTYPNADEAIEVMFVWGADWSVTAAVASIDGMSLGEGAGHVLSSRLRAGGATSDIFVMGILDQDFYRKNDFLDNGLYVAMDNVPSGTDLTGGDTADSLVATVYYVLQSFI